MLITTIRGLRRSPGLAIAAVLCLALGAAATTAVSTLVGALLLRPLPFPDADRLMRVWFDEPERRDPRVTLDPRHPRLRASRRVRSIRRHRARSCRRAFGSGAERLRGEAV